MRVVKIKNSREMRGTIGPIYPPLLGVYNAYRAPLVPLHCTKTKYKHISRCKNAMDMWVFSMKMHTKCHGAISMLSSSISPIALHNHNIITTYLGAKMQWICGFLCEKCQKGDPPPKKGGIFMDFWKFTP